MSASTLGWQAPALLICGVQTPVQVEIEGFTEQVLQTLQRKGVNRSVMS
jgi:hypothetical protein